MTKKLSGTEAKGTRLLFVGGGDSDMSGSFATYQANFIVRVELSIFCG